MVGGGLVEASKNVSPAIMQSAFRHDDVALTWESLNWLKRLIYQATQDSEFRFLAGEILGGGLDIESISKAHMWTQGKIAFAPSPPGAQEILDWRELVKRGAGKCTDTSILVAALLKTRGIPVKLRATKRPGTDVVKYGHVYVRALDRRLGKWINVDTQFPLGVKPPETDFMEVAA